MIIKCGIIGLPNVGKSTLFNILTNNKVKNKNFPFCTIKPNFGNTKINCNKINEIIKISKTKKIILPSIQYVDIAGLIKGSSKGLGIGNKFLEDIRKVNILLHVIKIFNNNKIINFYENKNPIEELNIIEKEIYISDIKLLKKIKKKIKKKNTEKKNIINKIIKKLKKYKNIQKINLSKKEKFFIKSINLLTYKKKIYILNISKNNNIKIQKKNLKKIKKYLIKKNIKNKIIILDIKKIYKNKQKNIIIQYDKINKINNLCLKLLNLKKFFTINKIETKLWLIKKKDNVLKAAKKIHSDFVKNFIKAEIINYNKFIKYNGWKNSKKIKKIKIKNKKYIPKNGDIINIIINKNKN